MRSVMVVGGECGELKKVCDCFVELRIIFYLRIVLG